MIKTETFKVGQLDGILRNVLGHFGYKNVDNNLKQNNLRFKIRSGNSTMFMRIHLNKCLNKIRHWQL